jgi:hypothetical protein
LKFWTWWTLREASETLTSDACEMSFQHITDTVNAIAKEKHEQEDGEDDSEICTGMRRFTKTFWYYKLQ